MLGIEIAYDNLWKLIFVQKYNAHNDKFIYMSVRKLLWTYRKEYVNTCYGINSN